MSKEWSPSGCLEDFSDMGFTDMDCICEFIDNAVDAKASEIEIRVIYPHESNKSLAIIADNAGGRSVKDLERSGRLFDRKQANDNKIGRFGMGGNIGSSQLTRLEGKALRLSKINGGLINQLELDYPTTKKDDTYKVCAGEATNTNFMVWHKYAINKHHGSLEILECPDSVVANLIEKFTLEKENLSRMYADYLEKGIKITFKVNDKVLIDLAAINVSDEKNATHIKRYDLSVWKNESDSKFAVEFENGNKELVYKDKKNGNQQIGDLSKLGYTKVGKITGTSTYNENWKKNSNDGGHYIKRVNKIIERFPIHVPVGGDYGLQNAKGASRHVWTFNTNLDTQIGIEINKSRINKDKFNNLIFEILNDLASKFSTACWNKIKIKKNKSESRPASTSTSTSVPASASASASASTSASVPASASASASASTSASVPASASASVPASESTSTSVQASTSTQVLKPSLLTKTSPLRIGDELEQLQVMIAIKATELPASLQASAPESASTSTSAPLLLPLTTPLPLVLQSNVTVKELKKLFNEHINKFKDNDHVSDEDQSYYNKLQLNLHKL